MAKQLEWWTEIGGTPQSEVEFSRIFSVMSSHSATCCKGKIRWRRPIRKTHMEKQNFNAEMGTNH